MAINNHRQKRLDFSPKIVGYKPFVTSCACFAFHETPPGEQSHDSAKLSREVIRIGSKYTGDFAQPTGRSRQDIEKGLRNNTISHRSFINRQDAFTILHVAMKLMMVENFKEILSQFKREFGDVERAELINTKGEIFSPTGGKYKSTLLIEAVKLGPNGRVFVKKLLKNGADMSLKDEPCYGREPYSAIGYAVGFEDYVTVLEFAEKWEKLQQSYPGFQNPFSLLKKPREPMNKKITTFVNSVSSGVLPSSLNKSFTDSSLIADAFTAELNVEMGGAVHQPLKGNMLKLSNKYFRKCIDMNDSIHNDMLVSNNVLLDRISNIENDISSIYRSLDISNILCHDEFEFVTQSTYYYTYYMRLSGLIERTMLEAGFVASGIIPPDTSSDKGMRVLTMTQDIANITSLASFNPIGIVAGQLTSIVLELAKKARKFYVIKQLIGRAERRVSNGRNLSEIGLIARKITIATLRQYHVSANSGTVPPNFVIMNDEGKAMAQADKMAAWFVAEIDENIGKIALNGLGFEGKVDFLSKNMYSRWNVSKNNNKVKRLIKAFYDHAPEVTSYINETIDYIATIKI